jgi:hypothetical protein
MHARMWGGLLQDTVSPLGDMVHLYVCLFVFGLNEQSFSYLAAVTFASDRTANLDLCLALRLLVVRVLLRATRDLRFQGHARKAHDSHF